MTTFRTTGRDRWSHPGSPYNDAQRRHAYGPIEPMEQPKLPLWRRLMGGR